MPGAQSSSSVGRQSPAPKTEAGEQAEKRQVWQALPATPAVFRDNLKYLLVASKRKDALLIRGQRRQHGGHFGALRGVELLNGRAHPARAEAKLRQSLLDD